MAHAVPSHVADPPKGDGHAVQEVVPHELVDVLLEHTPLQGCDPTGHTHFEPWQTVRPMQTLPHAPQLFGSLVVSAHVVPQSVDAPDRQPDVQERPPPVEGLQTGVPPLHVDMQLPQCAAVVMSVSHPSVTSVLQSAQPG